MRYRIREADGEDDEVADHLQSLHTLTFADTAPAIHPEMGLWWLAFADGAKEPIAFAGVFKSPMYADSGYFNRVGVLQEHRGHGLQLRFMSVIEARARREGWRTLYSDTTDNPYSANCFVKRGWRMFVPETLWGPPHALYWRKSI